jgi:ATP-binding cassette subfamily B protein
MDQAPAQGGWRALTRLLRPFLRPYRGRIILVTALLVTQAVGNLVLPLFTADIINNGVVKGDIGHIWRTGGVMLGVVFALGALSIATTYVAVRVTTSTAASIRAAIYRRVQAFSGREMSRFGIPSLITRNVSDVDQVEIFLQLALTELVVAVVMSGGAVVMAVRESPALSLVLVVTIVVMAVIIVWTLAFSVPMARSVQAKIDRINRVMRDQITGARVIRAFGRTRFERDRFRAANADLTEVTLRITRLFALALPLLIGVINLVSVGVVWFGARLVGEGAMPIGNMIAFLSYLVIVLLYVLTAVTVMMLFSRAVASAERIGEVLHAVPAIADPARPAVPAKATGAVEFRSVTFGYPGSERSVLNELSFTFGPGQTSAIIGGTGSGKTTVLNVIMRFFDVTGGAVLVNGTDIRQQRAEELWSGIGLVPQTAYLFGGTVASNLRFGRPQATDAQLWHALEVAQARDFVASMPGQLDAPIDQGGTNVSGGQRQRLCVARALVRRSPLYLFDDCFSALDPATDARLRSALRAETHDAAVLIVAQRVSTIMHADQIVVLDAGAVAGIGTHQQLVASCAPYREIVASQLGEGEAA